MKNTQFQKNLKIILFILLSLYLAQSFAQFQLKKHTLNNGGFWHQENTAIPDLIFINGFETGPIQVVNQASGLFDFTCVEFPSLLTGAAPQALTIELWFKRGIILGTILERFDGPVGSRDVGGVGFGLIQQGASNEIWWFEGGWSAPIFSGLSRGVWYHLVIQRAGDSLWVWVNGQFKDEFVLPNDLGLNFPSGISTHIGCDGDESSGGTTDEFMGSLDELRISTTARYEPFFDFVPPCGYVSDIETHALYKMEVASTGVIEDSGPYGYDGNVIGGAVSTDTPVSGCF